MPIFSFFRRRAKKKSPKPVVPATPAPKVKTPISPWDRRRPQSKLTVRRHFYNERGFQCYATFFPHWEGWITAGHVLTDAAHAWPDFTGDDDDTHLWPEGLDAALRNCSLPAGPPPNPKVGQKIVARGYPAGSRHLEERHGHVYLERGAGSGVWIAHIRTPDEPVVTGMSGGPVMDAETGEPIGILITRNSPADLNADRDPDESCDFVSLRAVWNAVSKSQNMA